MEYIIYSTPLVGLFVIIVSGVAANNKMLARRKEAQATVRRLIELADGDSLVVLVALRQGKTVAQIESELKAKKEG